jgi:hypothetical protein
MLRCARGEEGRRSITFQRSDDEEEEQQHGKEEQGAEEDQGGEEEWRGGEAENVGEGPNEERRRLSLSVCRGRLRGATWLLLLLRPYGKRIGFWSGQ